MSRQERLDDGSVIEELKVRVGGKEYYGRLRIRQVDRSIFAFDVWYSSQYHCDKSYFKRIDDEQIRIYASSILKQMVEKELKDESTS
jgi:hypothetical protein